MWVGLNPGTPGSHPGPKAGAKPLSHPGIPPLKYFYYWMRYLLINWLITDYLLCCPKNCHFYENKILLYFQNLLIANTLLQLKYFKNVLGASRCLIWLSIPLLITAHVLISGSSPSHTCPSPCPHWALHWAWNMLKILSPSLSLIPTPLQLVCSPSFKNFFKYLSLGCLGGSAVKLLPLT